MSVEPGWYTDPYDDAKIRFWDGSTWTDRSADRGSAPDGGNAAPSGTAGPQSGPAAGAESGGSTEVLPVVGSPSAGTGADGQGSRPTGASAVGSLYGTTPEHAPSASDAPGWAPAGGFAGGAAVAGAFQPGGPGQTGTYGPGGPGAPGGQQGFGPGGQGSPGGFGPAGPGGQQGFGPGGPGAQGGFGPGGPHGPGPGPGGQGGYGPGGQGGYGPGGFGPGGPGGYGAGEQPEKKRNPAVIVLLALLGVAIVGAGVYFGINAMSDDDAASPTPVPTTQTQPTVSPTEEPTTEEPTTEEPTTEEPTTEEPTTEEPTTEEPTYSFGEINGNGESGAAYFVDSEGEMVGTRFESAIDTDMDLTLTLRIDERAAVIFGGHSLDGEDLQFRAVGDAGEYSGDDSYGLLPVFGFSQQYLDPAGAWVMEPGDYEFIVSEWNGDATGMIFEVHAGSLVVGVPSDTPVTIEDGRPSVFILHVGEETPLRAGIHGDEDTVIHVIDPELFVYYNDDAPPEHEPRNPLDASVDIELMPVGDSVIVGSTFWGSPTDAVVHIHPR